MSTQNSSHGTLFVVATPIGNLDDMSPRAINTLKQVDSIAAEDTRHAKKLLQHFGIGTPMQAYHDHNEKEQSHKLITQLKQGSSVALISDAGTPLISDPGFRLTQAAHEANINTVPIVGACAAIAALSVAGLPSDRFTFEGFLPNKSSQRKIKLAEVANCTQTLIFYESPHRILSSLQDLAEILGKNRSACLCRELTKTFETVKQANLADLVSFVENDTNQQKGEIVIVIAGAELHNSEIDTKTESLLLTLQEHMPPKKAAAIVSEISGIKKNKLYEHALQLNMAKGC